MPTLKARIGGVWTPVAYGMPPVFGSVTPGIVPASGGGTSNYLRADGVWTAVSAAIDPGSDQTFARLRLSATDDASLASTLHALQIGPTAGANVIMDGNELMARNNGATTPLYINNDGGPVALGTGWWLGQHPTHASAPGLWRHSNGPTPGAPYILLAYSNDIYLNVDIAAGAGQLRHNNAGRLTWDSTKVTSNVDHFMSASCYSGSGEWFRVRGNTGIYWEDWGGGWNMSDGTWLRAYGSKGIYTAGEIRAGDKFTVSGNAYMVTNDADQDTGLYYVSDGYCGIVCNGGWAVQGKSGVMWSPQYRIYNIDDGNHALFYSNATPSGSGEGSNGPRLQGYSSVWLYGNATGKSLFLSSGGDVFISAGNAYRVFSSREFKDNIEPLDPDECLDHVLRWQPVEYDAHDWPHRHLDGFISEDHVQVTPQMVYVRGEHEERPGWANAMDYSAAAPRLAGAIQALARRLAALEAA